jgi:hypothetical protein
MKISLHTAQKLLREADDLWVGHRTADYTLSLARPPEDVFFHSVYEDDEGLTFEYTAVGEDNATVELNGHILTLMEMIDGSSEPFDVTLLKKWDAETYLGRCVE